METAIYQELIAQEDTHWWFAGRRAISTALLQKLRLPNNAAILEAGCGSGGNLAMLSRFGQVYGFEMNDIAREHAQARHVAQIAYGTLPDGIPFHGQNFDVIALFDVLEHIENDRAALIALAGHLNPGGVLLLTVPAFQFLYSAHDRLHHHHRRYSKTALKNVIASAGLRLERVSYWNFFLFPVAVLARFFMRNQTPGAKTPAPIINALLSKLVAVERFLLPLPFGLSLIAVVRKN